jgi:NAD(P)-dependent dehydrogenase (short-subunit alcohol dehydrogenase family)
VEAVQRAQARLGELIAEQGLDRRALGLAAGVSSSTKLALRYFSNGLSREARGSPVRVGTMIPGMVATDALIQAYQGGTRPTGAACAGCSSS